MSHPEGSGWGQPQQSNYPGSQRSAPSYQNHPQQSFYGGYPGGPQRPDPKKDKTGLWVMIGALTIIIALGVTLLVVLTSKDDPAPQAAPTSSPVAAPLSSATSPLNPSTSESNSPSPSAEENNRVDAVTPGWQGILSTRDGAAYDLPPDNWETLPGYTSGFEDGPVKVYLHESVTFRLGACAGVRGSNRALAGFMTADDLAPDVAARGSVRMWAQAAGTSRDGVVPEIAMPTTTQFPIDGGKIQATSATITFTPPGDDKCPAPRVQVTSAVFQIGTKTTCFLLVTDQKVPDALPAEDAKKILASLRPHS